jgi:hypothetical protein
MRRWLRFAVSRARIGVWLLRRLLRRRWLGWGLRRWLRICIVLGMYFLRVKLFRAWDLSCFEGKDICEVCSWVIKYGLLTWSYLGGRGILIRRMVWEWWCCGLCWGVGGEVKMPRVSELDSVLVMGNELRMDLVRY